MKKLILALVLSTALSALAIGAPAIYVAQHVHNFGSVFEGIAVKYTFVIENRGDEALDISGVSASCGCTTTSKPTEPIEPGESFALDVLINTTGFGGTISKSITVYSNDPDSPLLSLRVTGQVLKTKPHHIPASDAAGQLYLLIDLRSPEDYEAHHLLGAINIPISDLTETLAALPRGVLIILYDASFDTSERAALALKDSGLRTTYALVGGIDEWIHRYGMRFVTNPEDPYELPLQITYTYEDGQQPTHYIIFEDLNALFTLYIDVRSADQYVAGHIAGSINIPFDDLEVGTDILPNNILLITYDQGGFFGDEAALWMINNGFSYAQSILGGLDEWIRHYGQSYLVPASQ